MVAFLLNFLLLFAIWILLTWSLNWQQLIAGVVVAVAVTAITGRLSPVKSLRIFQPVRVLWFLLYIPYFLWYVLLANLDVAYRVLHPELPIKPGIVRFKTTLKTHLAQTVLANSITLTPGTMTVDIIDQDMYIHWINIKGEREEEWFKHIAGRFEGIIRRIFE